MIAIIDYGMGNLRSVLNALKAVDAEARIVEHPRELQDSSGVVLPGVGAFGDGIRNLRARGWDDALSRRVREEGRPLLGLCLGMQLLALESHEHGRHGGLGWLDATVRRLPAEIGSERLRIPHIGWNEVRFERQDGLYRGLGPGQAFYFVHSYYVDVSDPAVGSGAAEYGVDFCASIETGNLFATQFHPEKSHKAGLAVLSNFVSIVRTGRC